MGLQSTHAECTRISGRDAPHVRNMLLSSIHWVDGSTGAACFGSLPLHEEAGPRSSWRGGARISLRQQLATVSSSKLAASRLRMYSKHNQVRASSAKASVIPSKQPWPASCLEETPHQHKVTKPACSSINALGGKRVRKVKNIWPRVRA